VSPILISKDEKLNFSPISNPVSVCCLLLLPSLFAAIRQKCLRKIFQLNFILFQNASNECFVLENSIGKWKTISKLPFHLAEGSAVGHNNDIYIFGGLTSNPGKFLNVVFELI
jgi:hypothetical protein